MSNWRRYLTRGSGTEPSLVESVLGLGPLVVLMVEPGWMTGESEELPCGRGLAMVSSSCPHPRMLVMKTKMVVSFMMLGIDEDGSLCVKNRGSRYMDSDA